MQYVFKILSDLCYSLERNTILSHCIKVLCLSCLCRDLGQHCHVCNTGLHVPPCRTYSACASENCMLSGVECISAKCTRIDTCKVLEQNKSWL